MPTGSEQQDKGERPAHSVQMFRGWRLPLPRFRKSWITAFRWAGTVIGAFLVAAVLALYFLDWDALRGPVARYASYRLGREVRIVGHLHVKLFTWQPRIDAGGLWMGNPKWLSGPAAAEIDHLTIELRLLPLLGGHLILPLVQIEHPKISVVREADGRTNWESPNGANGWDIPPIRRFLLDDGHIRVDDRKRNLTFVGTVSSRETNDAAPTRAFQLTGDGTLNEKKFTANIHGGALIHVDESRPYAFAADVRAGATHAVIDGSITRPFHLGRYSTTATVTGDNLADLYDLTGVALPGSRPYRISGVLTREGPLYRFVDFSGVVGGSDLRGQASVDTSGDVPFLRGTITSRTLDFADLGPIVGSRPAAAGSSGLFPDTHLHVEKLRMNNAEVDYTADSMKSRDFPLRKLATHISLENGVLLLKPLAFDFPNGKLAGFIRIDARRRVAVTNLDARLTGARMEQFIQSPDKKISGLLEARAVLAGSGDSVRKVAKSASGAVTAVVPEGRVRRSIAEWLGVNVLSALGLELSGDASEASLRCALAHFRAENGNLVAQKLVFDTEPVQITANGNIDLRDETINLIASGKPKHFQLFRLNVPITVQGPLARPVLGVKAGAAIGQGVIAVALGFLAPPAAILPFVDADLAKNANCAALAVEAGTRSAPVKIVRPSLH